MGLHRVEAIKQNIELRRRLWGACVISDRWQVDIHFVPDFQPLFSSALADVTFQQDQLIVWASIHD